MNSWLADLHQVRIAARTPHRTRTGSRPGAARSKYCVCKRLRGARALVAVLLAALAVWVSSWFQDARWCSLGLLADGRSSTTIQPTQTARAAPRHPCGHPVRGPHRCGCSGQATSSSWPLPPAGLSGKISTALGVLYPVPTATMLQRIANLLRREPAYTRVKVLNWDDVRLTIDRFVKPCGHLGFMIGVEVFFEHRDRWLTVACFSDLDLGAVLKLLTEANDYIQAEDTDDYAPPCLD